MFPGWRAPSFSTRIRPAFSTTSNSPEGPASIAVGWDADATRVAFMRAWARSGAGAGACVAGAAVAGRAVAGRAVDGRAVAAAPGVAPGAVVAAEVTGATVSVAVASADGDSLAR